MEKKLHVPSPHERNVDRSALWIGLLAAFLAFLLAAIGLSRLDQKRDIARMQKDPTTTPAGVPLDPMQLELKQQRKRSQELSRMNPGDFDTMEWTKEDIAVVFRFGPRMASEAMCRQLAPSIADGSLPGSTRLELEKTLDRRTEFAPWTCMLRLHLAGSLEGDLAEEMDEFWGELERHEGNARLIATALADFRETRDRPESPEFYAWLRMCSFDLDYEAHPECQRLVNQIRPQQGADMLGMLEKHWEEVGIRPDEMPWVARTLGFMARNGQPRNFRVDETEALPAYDVDFRQATIGYLCRLANTPTPRERSGIDSEYDEVPVLASEELRKVAERGARSYEERLLRRWRETCLLGFGGNGGYQDEPHVGVPFLAVWDGALESAPDYTIASVIARGDCKTRATYPAWYCLSQSWLGEGKTIQRALAEFFVETRYMEWVDFGDDDPIDRPEAEEPAGEEETSARPSEVPKLEKPSQSQAAPEADDTPKTVAAPPQRPAAKAEEAPPEEPAPPAPKAPPEATNDAAETPPPVDPEEISDGAPASDAE